MQQDFVPGLDLSVHFTATKVGRYEIVCTQLCRSGLLQVGHVQPNSTIGCEASGYAVRTVRSCCGGEISRGDLCTRSAPSHAEHHAPPTSFIRETRFQRWTIRSSGRVLRAGPDRRAGWHVSFLVDCAPPGMDQLCDSGAAFAHQERCSRRRDDAGVSIDDHARHDHGLFCAYHGAFVALVIFLPRTCPFRAST